MKHCERAPLAANEKMFLLKTLENRHAMLCFLLFAGGGGLPRKFFPPLSLSLACSIYMVMLL